MKWNSIQAPTLIPKLDGTVLVRFRICSQSAEDRSNNGAQIAKMFTNWKPHFLRVRCTYMSWLGFPGFVLESPLDPQYIYWDSKLLAPVIYFADSISTSLWAVWAEQHAWFLPQTSQDIYWSHIENNCIFSLYLMFGVFKWKCDFI